MHTRRRHIILFLGIAVAYFAASNATALYHALRFDYWPGPKSVQTEQAADDSQLPLKTLAQRRHMPLVKTFFLPQLVLSHRVPQIYADRPFRGVYFEILPFYSFSPTFTIEVRGPPTFPSLHA
jgi:hypothetical protein